MPPRHRNVSTLDLKPAPGDNRTCKPATPEHIGCRGVRLLFSHVGVIVLGARRDRCVREFVAISSSVESKEPIEGRAYVYRYSRPN